eukprot:366627_1
MHNRHRKSYKLNKKFNCVKKKCYSSKQDYHVMMKSGHWYLCKCKQSGKIFYLWTGQHGTLKQKHILLSDLGKKHLQRILPKLRNVKHTLSNSNYYYLSLKFKSPREVFVLIQKYDSKLNYFAYYHNGIYISTNNFYYLLSRIWKYMNTFEDVENTYQQLKTIILKANPTISTCTLSNIPNEYIQSQQHVSSKAEYKNITTITPGIVNAYVEQFSTVPECITDIIYNFCFRYGFKQHDSGNIIPTCNPKQLFTYYHCLCTLGKHISRYICNTPKIFSEICNNRDGIYMLRLKFQFRRSFKYFKIGFGVIDLDTNTITMKTIQLRNNDIVEMVVNFRQHYNDHLEFYVNDKFQGKVNIKWEVHHTSPLYAVHMHICRCVTQFKILCVHANSEYVWNGE